VSAAALDASMDLRFLGVVVGSKKYLAKAAQRLRERFGVLHVRELPWPSLRVLLAEEALRVDAHLACLIVDAKSALARLSEAFPRSSRRVLRECLAEALWSILWNRHLSPLGVVEIHACRDVAWIVRHAREVRVVVCTKGCLSGLADPVAWSVQRAERGAKRRPSRELLGRVRVENVSRDVFVLAKALARRRSSRA